MISNLYCVYVGVLCAHPNFETLALRHSLVYITWPACQGDVCVRVVLPMCGSNVCVYIHICLSVCACLCVSGFAPVSL